jgi:hypothetical protein
MLSESATMILFTTVRKDGTTGWRPSDERIQDRIEKEKETAWLILMML